MSTTTNSWVPATPDCDCNLEIHYLHIVYSLMVLYSISYVIDNEVVVVKKLVKNLFQ